jgi:hypothetical protein
MGGGGGSAVEKKYCTGPCKLATIPLYNLLRSPVGAHVHKTTYGPLVDTALYLILLMRANPLQGQGGGGWSLEIWTFLGPKWQSPNGSMPFHRAQKSQFPGLNPLPLALVMDLPASKALRTGPYESYVQK